MTHHLYPHLLLIDKCPSSEILVVWSILPLFICQTSWAKINWLPSNRERITSCDIAVVFSVCSKQIYVWFCSICYRSECQSPSSFIWVSDTVLWPQTGEGFSWYSCGDIYEEMSPTLSKTSTFNFSQSQFRCWGLDFCQNWIYISSPNKLDQILLWLFWSSLRANRVPAIYRKVPRFSVLCQSIQLSTIQMRDFSQYFIANRLTWTVI